MSVLDKSNSSIEEVVDGIILLIKKCLIANTHLTSDATIGSTVLSVDNSRRFKRGEQIAIFNNNSIFNPDMNQYEGIEIHTVYSDPISTGEILLKEPLGMNFTTSSGGRIQKTIRGAVLLEKDVYYGDREVIPFNQVAIAVEPEGLTGEWIALEGLLSNEFTCGVMIFVKPKGGGDDSAYQSSQEVAMRTCNAYAKAVYDMFLGNIHLDILMDEVPLAANAKRGQNKVLIASKYAADWPEDECTRYEVQDNWRAEQDFWLPGHSPSSSSSSSSLPLVELSSSSSSSSSMNSSSSSPNSESSSSSLSSSSSASSFSSGSSTSESSYSSLSVFPESSSSSLSSTSVSESSSSSESSTSSLNGEWVEVTLSRNLLWNYRVSDKAVLRRKWRYMYDSKISNAEFGTVQKGSAILKAARMSWFGKETQQYSFPQVGLGGNQ